MPPEFSKTRLSAYIDAYVKRSKSLGSSDYFNHEDIAKAVFGKTDKHAAQHFSAACSPGNRAPLRERVVTESLDACSRLLQAQYKRLGTPDSDTAVTQFERELCNTLRIPGDGPATPDDFRTVPMIETATSVQVFGIPDILEWPQGPFDFAADLKAVQSRSIEALRSILDWIVCCGDDRRRLHLAYVAVSASMLNHPGSKWHEEAFELAMRVACEARVSVFAAAQRVPEDLRLQAIRLEHQLLWNRILPTLESPSNYMRSALLGRPMPSNILGGLKHVLATEIIGAKRMQETDPTNQRVIRHLSSALSMQARLMLATGNAADLRDADKMFKESLRGIEKLSTPYGFAYPILKDIVQSKFKHALQKIEAAIAALEQAGSMSSAAAHAALHIHVSHLLGKSGRTASRTAPTNDSHIRALATRAVASAGICYQHSHVFDAAAVRRLLYPGTARTR